MEGGLIVLNGRLATFYEKQMATELTRHVAGVHGVEDRIEVESNPSRIGFERPSASGLNLSANATGRVALPSSAAKTQEIELEVPS